MRITRSPASIYQLKVTLRDSKPPIWRRIQVPGDVTLSKLHDIIQAAMGWSDSHLHQFIVGSGYRETRYGVPHPDYDLDIQDESRVKLSSVAPNEKSKFTYEYDFGDSWEHTILVEKILPPEPGKHYPHCLTARRACPPEDSGGVWGYADLLERVQDPDDPESEELQEWLGEDFDPKEVDVDEINAALRLIR